MNLEPFPGFQHFTTHHCVTGSLRHIYEYYGYPISEEMLLGLGAGVGFIYWHTQGTLPFLGGRANLERPGEEGLEKCIGRRTGVQVATTRTSSAAKAEKALLERLAAAEPALLLVDMGFLPYFDFGGSEFHFGYHAVVACGYDARSRQVLLADRDEMLHPVDVEILAKARGSKYRPFPPKNACFTFDFAGRHPPRPEELRIAIRQAAEAMLEPPITNIGIKGIRKVARRIQDWPAILDEKSLREACINTSIMIDARGGTGGGLFRYMYGRFLEEAADLTGKPELCEAGRQMQAVGDRWEAVAGLFERAFQAEKPAETLAEACAILTEIAGQEELAWERLLKLVS